MAEDSKKLGAKIKQLRLEKGMSQDDLAKAANITKSAVSKYERGMRTPQAAALYYLAHALNVPLSELTAYTLEGDGHITRTYNDDKRPRRIKRLLAAFEKLSDEAQKIAIQRVEELAFASKYRVSLEESLRRYVYNKCIATYMPDECKEEIETYEYETDGNPEPESYPVNVKHIIMHRDIDGKTSFWRFLYYQFKDEKTIDNGKLIREIIDRNDRIAKRPDDSSNSRYTLIFDNEAIYERFCECRRDQISEDGHPEDEPLTFQPALSFLLIDKESLVVKGEFEDVKGVEDEYGSDVWG